MSRLPDESDDVRVFDQRGRRMRGTTAAERAVLEQARRMRAAGEPVGQVIAVPVADALDRERVNRLAAHLRAILTEVDAGRLDASPTLRARIEAAAVALEAIHDEPALVDLDGLAGRPLEP